MRQIIIAVLFFAMAESIAVAQTQLPATTEPQPAMEIIDHAVHQARRSHKPIVVMFQSSLSNLGKQLDSMLTATGVKNIFEKYFVVTHINVQEHAGVKDSLENPGGTVMMKAFAGGEPLLPFCVFFNKRGRKIADANLPLDQTLTGYSAAKNDIDAFFRLLQQCAPHIPKAQIRSLMQYFDRSFSR